MNPAGRSESLKDTLAPILFNLRYISLVELTFDHLSHWEDFNNDQGTNYNGYGFIVEDVYDK
jgi:hypothetical protein